MAEYPTEQLWQLYEKLPDDLKEAVFSEKTAENIRNICERSGLGEKTPQVAKQTGYVLLGLLTPGEFQKSLQEELGLKSGDTKKVSREINRFVFFPVKNSLEALYKVEIEKPTTRSIEKELPKESKARAQEQDIYREAIE